MRQWISVVAFVVGCGSPQAPAKQEDVGNVAPDAGPPALRQDVSCGQDTCGPDEYCENRCLCCGMSADPAELRGTSGCLPLPAACHDANPPECQQRTVDIPCA